MQNYCFLTTYTIPKYCDFYVERHKKKDQAMLDPKRPVGGD